MTSAQRSPIGFANAGIGADRDRCEFRLHCAGLSDAETIAFGGDHSGRVSLAWRNRYRTAPSSGRDGRFLCELLRVHPNVEIDCVDASARMLELARRRIERRLPAGATRMRFLQQDIASWMPPYGTYDLIVTHFFLDCFAGDRIAEVVNRLSGAATPSPTWLLADFRVPDRGFARLHAQAWLVAMYRFFSVTARIEATELTDPTPHIQAKGFALARQHLFRRGMLKSQLWRRGGRINGITGFVFFNLFIL